MKLYREDGRVAGLQDIAAWWIRMYPSDVFGEKPKDIIAIREIFRKMTKEHPQFGKDVSKILEARE
jgi:hypothetical protein